MRWRKLGRVFTCDGTRAWSRSHAAVPTVGAVEGPRARIYYSARDGGQRSHTGWFDLDLTAPRVVTASPNPILEPGPVGRFDDSGAMVTWVHPRPAGGRFLYYIGWNRGQTVPFRNSLGLMVEDPAGVVRRFGDGPILDRSVYDPCFVASACVLEEPDGWQMWYLSCIDWRPTPSGLQHRYHLKHATSDNGTDWRRDGTVCISFRDDTEYAISRPSVLREGRLYRMWYSYRGDRYRIGYAESADGRRWERQDHRAGIDVTPGDWDGEMVCYPCVFDAQGSRYMLYNGNGYGATGIGLAVLDQD
jgi:hypothetical protein